MTKVYKNFHLCLSAKLVLAIDAFCLKPINGPILKYKGFIIYDFKSRQPESYLNKFIIKLSFSNTN